MENTPVIKPFKVHCPKLMLSRHKELQRIFKSNSASYCVKVVPRGQSYVLKFATEEFETQIIEEETTEQGNYSEETEQRNYNETNCITKIRK